MGRREEIIFGHDVPNEDILRFEDVTVQQLNELVDENLIDLDDTQNNSPTFGEIIKFMNKYPEFYAHGYVVSESRSDARVSLEGVQLISQRDLEQEIIDDFHNLFRNADEFDEEDLYVWYD